MVRMREFVLEPVGRGPVQPSCMFCQGGASRVESWHHANHGPTPKTKTELRWVIFWDLLKTPELPRKSPHHSRILCKHWFVQMVLGRACMHQALRPDWGRSSSWLWGDTLPSWPSAWACAALASVSSGLGQESGLPPRTSGRIRCLVLHEVC